MPETKMFTFYWLTGLRDVSCGVDAADALNKAGYGEGAIRALDFYAEGNNHDYEWLDRKWVRRDDS